MLTARRLLARVPALAADAGLAALVSLVAVSMDAFDPDNTLRGGAIFWDIAVAAPLLLRRRAPALAAAAIGAICLLQWAIGSPADGDFAVLVMLYSLGVHERRRWVLAAAAAVAELGVVLAVTKWAPPTHAWLLLLMATGTVTASWLLGVYVHTHRAYLAATLARAEAAERDRDLQAAAAVDAERARMAREMHDIVAHSLSVMITLNDAAAAVADPHAARRAAAQASDVGRVALSEMRRLLDVLRPNGPAELAPQPGIERLPDLVAAVRAAGLAVELITVGRLDPQSTTTELAVYRIVQESLTNILKHARNVTRVTIEVVFGAGRVRVTVRNNGDVVGPATARGLEIAVGGHGVTGMRERANVHGGRLTAGPAQGGGWVVAAELVGASPPAGAVSGSDADHAGYPVGVK